ncbi:hypothetical protein RhiirA4_480428 [Rhizophagus irregularis]|uniref:Uncharacterized protein n=1 Tax=Rhizophagus irregularis TaxID=588596 RepID=A0A2I1HHX6_9GLOM|nr:hypothetical protein RhiirA4_480428 [Rhizophagus irregularis]
MRIGRKEKSKAIINNDAEIPKDLFEGTSSDYDATGENLDEYNSYVDSDEDDPELQEMEIPQDDIRDDISVNNHSHDKFLSPNASCSAADGASSGFTDTRNKIRKRNLHNKKHPGDKNYYYGLPSRKRRKALQTPQEFLGEFY